jgi:hypothetical protein
MVAARIALADVPLGRSLQSGTVGQLHHGGRADVTLNYQSTSFHDALYARDVFRLRGAPDDWLFRAGIADASFRLAGNGLAGPRSARHLTTIRSLPDQDVATILKNLWPSLRIA